MPALSFEQLGIIIVAMLVLSQWYFSWRSDQRAAAREHEPRANPPLHQTFATREHHAELKAEVEKIDGERRTSVANLHKKIDDLAKRLDDRIDEIPGRTIALLNDTKQLHRS